MQSTGAVMSYNIVIGIATYRTLLKENSGKAEFLMTWVQSLFK